VKSSNGEKEIKQYFVLLSPGSRFTLGVHADSALGARVMGIADLELRVEEFKDQK
tara:strand:- start:1170 stop:1334 length:165 start_codon:yes stop_codon:yes gene_type:complete